MFKIRQEMKFKTQVKILLKLKSGMNWNEPQLTFPSTVTNCANSNFVQGVELIAKTISY